eukprot:TRINITY_DN1466_c1_g2_i1.p1 TRINITY_DN1466_c1_g2~~TRINITY_DN1466_c1_g2_i1.p1  ORF type:complete len:1680 (+),score=335.47 TRINITY_DN1466_c1_g2_i1:75-5042(+)
MGYTDIDRKRKLNEAVQSPKPPPSNPSMLNGAKVSLARWFYQRLFIKKTQNVNSTVSQQTPHPIIKETDTIKETEIQHNTKLTSSTSTNTPGGELTNMVREILDETKISVVIVGPNSTGKSQILNALVQATCVSNEEYGQDNIFADAVIIETNTNNNPLPHLTDDDLKTFILPQGLCGNRGKPILLRYGKIVELVVTFHRETDLPASSISNVVRPFLGKSFQCQGSGASLSQDLQFIRNRFRELMSHYGPFIRECKISAPSSIVKGDRHVIELSDLFAAGADVDANVVIMTHDHRGLTNESKDFLRRNKYLDKLAQKPNEHKLTFVESTETGCRMNQNMIAVFKQFMMEEGLADELVDRIGFEIEKIMIKPLLFASIHGNDSIEGETSEEIMRSTRVPMLLAMIENMQLSMNAKTLSSLNEKWMSDYTPDGSTPVVNAVDQTLNTLREQANNVLKMLQGPLTTPMGPSDPNTTTPTTPGQPLAPTPQNPKLPRISSLTPEKISSWKEDVVESLGIKLEQNAGEWSAFLQSEEGKGLIRQHEMEHPESIGEVACGSLMRSAPEFWKKTVLGQIHPKLQEILTTSSELLRECLSQVGTPQEPTTLDKIRLRKLNEFCNRVHQRTTERVQHFKEMLEADADSLVQSACSEVLESNQLMNLSTTPITSYHLPPQMPVDLPFAAAKNIQQKFSDLLGAGLQQLVAVTKELDSSAITVLAALQTRPDTHLAIADTYRRLKQEEVLLLKEKQEGQSKLEPWAVVSGARTSIDEVNTPILFTAEGWHLFARQTDQNSPQNPRGNTNHSLRKKTRFLDQLKNAGLVILDVIPDGNSQFRALAQQVYGSQDAHPIVRVLVMIELLTHGSRYEKFMSRGPLNIQEYVLRMSKENEAGDHITLSAFSNFFGADLLVYGPIFARPLLVQSVHRRSAQVHCLAYVDGNQFKSLISHESEISRRLGTDIQIPKKRKTHDHPTPMSEEEDNNEHGDDNNDMANIQDEDNMEIDDNTKDIGSISVSNVETPTSLASDPIEIDIEMAPRSPQIQLPPQPQTINVLQSNRRVSSLLDICTKKLIYNNNLALFPQIGHLLPEELIQQCLSALISMNRLDSTSLDLLITSRLSTLRLDQTSQLTDNLCRQISQNCVNLSSLSITGCSRVTSEGASHLFRSISRLESLSLEGCINIGDSAINTLIGHHGSSLISVNLRGCNKVSEDVLANLLRTGTCLQSLTVRECHVSEGICGLAPPTLLEVDLTDCQRVGDAGLINLARRCPQLKQLRIGASTFRSQITDNSIIEVAERCPWLSEIDLTGCDLLTDRSISTLVEKCFNLETLIIAGCKSVTSLPKSLPCSLKSFDLSRCLNVTDQDLTRLAESCRGLELINLSACEEITDEGLTRLSKSCPGLREINLSSCGRVGDDGIKSLAYHCNGLEKVTLYNCSRVTDESIGDLSKHCFNLLSIDVSSCEQITDKSLSYLANSNCAGKLRAICLEETQASDIGLSELARGCSGLTTLKLAYCRSVSDIGLNHLAKGCSQISCLDLSYCNGIKISALISALDRWSNLRELHLRGYVGVGTLGSSESLQHKNLRTLDLSWCKQLDDETVARLGCGCPNLKDLDLAWCGRITVRAVVSLSQNCQDLHHLNLRGCTRVSFLTTGLLPSSHIRIYR